MKIVCTALLFLTSVFSYSQNDTNNRDRTHDGVHLKSACVVDTTLVLHKNKLLVIKDSTNLTHEFVTGSETYVEVWLRSTFCHCTDCSFSHHVIVKISGLNESKKLVLSPQNTTWITCNSFMMKSALVNFSGVLSLSANNLFYFEIARFVPGQPSLKYDGIKIERVLK